MNKEKLAIFLIKYAAFTPDEADNFILSFPNDAAYLANKIRNSIINDKGVSEEFKQKIGNRTSFE